MDEEILVEELDQKGLTRRDLLKRTAGVGVGLSALGMFEVQSASGAAELTKVKWISPRGTLDVMDDFNLWVPIKMGYYRRLGIDLSLSPGDASGNLPQVAAKQIDMGYPSPGVLTSSVEASIPVISIWEQ